MLAGVWDLDLGMSQTLHIRSHSHSLCRGVLEIMVMEVGSKGARVEFVSPLLI